MPRKPTVSFGGIDFGKDGSVTPRIKLLSDNKQVQEREAFDFFARTFNARFPNNQLKVLEQLPEQDHDFLIDLSGTQITVQLTELVDRSFVRAMTQEEYDSGAFKEMILKVSGERPLGVDPAKRDAALGELIGYKAGRYPKPSQRPLWLVVYSTAHYLLAYWHQGRYVEEPALIMARAVVDELKHNPFQRVWFTDMETNPVLVWPKDAQQGAPGDRPRPAGSAGT
jgi:hypothetical protein